MENQRLIQLKGYIVNKIGEESEANGGLEQPFVWRPESWPERRRLRR